MVNTAQEGYGSFKDMASVSDFFLRPWWVEERMKRKRLDEQHPEFSLLPEAKIPRRVSRRADL